MVSLVFSPEVLNTHLAILNFTEKTRTVQLLFDPWLSRGMRAQVFAIQRGVGVGVGVGRSMMCAIQTPSSSPTSHAYRHA